MLKVGITGGIGSGKTTVCLIFETLGIPVYYADARAKWLMENDPELAGHIRQIFGPEAYLKDGSLHRSFIASVAFKDPEKLGQLNAAVHPAVFQDGEEWIKKQAGVPYTLKEAALIFESGSDRGLDKIITVTAPAELRIQRVMQRDGMERSAVEARMARQMPEEEKIRRSDYVIYNDGAQSLIAQVLHIHRQLLDLGHGENTG